MHTSGEIELERLAVVTIQGGGVYGLTVAGQLDRVVKGMRLTPAAIAGTSAGAIVSGLYWSGMTPADICEAFLLLARRGQIEELLGPSDITFRDLQAVHGDLLETFEQVRSYSDRSFFERDAIHQLYAFVRHLVPGYWRNRSFLSRLKHRGLFPGEVLEKAVDSLIWSSRYMCQFHSHLRPIMGGESELRFGHIQRLEEQFGKPLFPALFITATNVRTKKIEVFNSLDPRFAQTPVARAIRASAGFPFAFQPVQVPTADSNDWYVDGGVISNFPVWIFGQKFREEISKSAKYAAIAWRPWMHVGLRRDPPPTGGTGDLREPKAFYLAIKDLLISGARDTLEEQIAAEMSSVVTIRQPESTTGGPENVLDVSKIDAKKVREMYVRGRWFARKALQQVNVGLDDRAKQRIDEELGQLIPRCNLVLGEQDNKKWDFRTNLYLPDGQKLYRRFWWNMKPPSGHGFDFNSGLTGYCYSRRVPMSCNLKLLRTAAEEGNLGEHHFGMTPEEHLMVDADRTWLLSMPVFDPNDFLVPLLAHLDPEEVGSPFHYVLPKVLNGVIYGVLNVDSRLNYADLGVSEDPAKSWTDSRLNTIIDLARVSAARVGRELARCFGKKEG